MSKGLIFAWTMYDVRFTVKQNWLMEGIYITSSKCVCVCVRASFHVLAGEVNSVSLQQYTLHFPLMWFHISCLTWTSVIALSSVSALSSSEMMMMMMMLWGHYSVGLFIGFNTHCKMASRSLSSIGFIAAEHRGRWPLTLLLLCI